MAIAVGLFSMLGGLMMLIQTPGPWWMWLEVPLYIIGPWVVGGWEVARRAGLTPGSPAT